MRYDPENNKAGFMIERRSLLIALAALPVVACSAGARAQNKIYRVGLLRPGPLFSDTDPYIVALTQGFTAHGYTVGGNLIIEHRAALGQVSRLPQLVDELIASHVDVLITLGYPTAVAAKDRSTVPVVINGAGDPVATHLVASLAHPGGNVTGVSELSTELSAKRVQLLKEAVPNLRKVAMLWNTDDLGMTLRYKAADTAAGGLGVAVQPLGVREPDDFDSAFAAMDRDPPDGILMVSDVLTLLNRKRVLDYGAAHKLPTMFETIDLARQGGLMSYGPEPRAMMERVTDLADRILKGALPADLPMEAPARYSLVINLKTAAALGLTMPPAIVARADEVVE